MIWALQSTGGTAAQELVNRHTLVKDLGILSRPGTTNINLRISQTLGYSVNGIITLLVNRKQTGQVNQLYLQQELKYSAVVEDNGRFRITNTLSHNLGLLFLFDSLTRFRNDETTLTTRLDIALGHHVAFNFTSALSTRLFNDYSTRVTDSGNQVRILNSGFFTPLLWLLSAGFTGTVHKCGRIILGLSSAKLTWVLNRQVYQAQGVETFFGAPQPKGYLLEYGLALQLLIDKDLFRRVHWNCDILVFKNYLKPVDLTLKNIFTVTINKFLQTNIQTRIFYEEEVSRSLQLENLVSLGFYFNL